MYGMHTVSVIGSLWSTATSTLDTIDQWIIKNLDTLLNGKFLAGAKAAAVLWDILLGSTTAETTVCILMLDDISMDLILLEQWQVLSQLRSIYQHERNYKS
jgi:hypothetical protein